MKYSVLKGGSAYVINGNHVTYH